MKKIMVLILFTVFLFVFSTAVSYAAIPMTFNDLDADTDGLITLSEAEARADIAKNWKDIDKNGDGTLNIKEYTAYEGKGRFEPPEDSEVSELGAAPFR